MEQTLVDQIREFLRPYGMFLIPESHADAILTKRGGRIHLTQTADGLRTEIVRRDGRTFTDLRPAGEPGELAIAVRALAYRARA